MVSLLVVWRGKPGYLVPRAIMHSLSLMLSATQLIANGD